MEISRTKSSVTVLILVIMLLSVVLARKDYRQFQVGSDFIKYHSNLTQSISQLHNVQQLQQAYEQDGIKSVDISIAMSNLKLEQLKAVFPLKFKSYQTIKINVGNNPIGNQGIQYLLSLIPKEVQNLQLRFDSIQTQDKLGQIMAKHLNNLKTLKSFKLSLILSAKKDIIIQDYFRYTTFNQQLQNYQLILIGNNLNKTSITYLKNHLEKTNKLKHLQLNLYANKIGVEGAQLLSQALQTQKQLQQLYIDLYFNNITEIGTQKLTKSIQSINNQNLKAFYLNLDFNYIKNEGGKAVGNLLSKMSQLVSLNIGVASKNFGYLGFKNVVNGINGLVNLKELTLRAGINRCGYQGAEATKQMLSKLTNLQRLSINFYQNYVGDDGIIIMSQAVSKIKNLRELYLNFGFNDAKGYGLVKGLKYLQNIKLNKFILSLSHNQFRDSQVNLIKDQLAKIIKNNQIFQFQFMQTAISKAKAKQLQVLFENTKAKTGHEAKIYVNSVISQEQQQKYKQQEKKRQQDLKNIDDQMNKKQSKKGKETTQEQLQL